MISNGKVHTVKNKISFQQRFIKKSVASALLTVVLVFFCSAVFANGNNSHTVTKKSKKTDSAKHAPALVGPEAVVSANKKALRQPNSKNYTNSIMKFDYTNGALYHIYTAPLRITDVQFKNDETITSVGAGDTARWQVSKTYSGSGDERREHLLIKPAEEDLENIIVVTTSQRAYHLILSSTENTFMAEVAWRYPKERKTPVYSNLSTPTEKDPPIDLKSIDFSYDLKVVRGKVPDWYPAMVFNDGKKTYIKFSPAIQEAPTLFSGTDLKNREMINYRVTGNYYIVDSVMTAFQLRSGQDEQYIIQISRK